jgi:negative regulator of flagellin synthesis FlgM
MKIDNTGKPLNGVGSRPADARAEARARAAEPAAGARAPAAVSDTFTNRLQSIKEGLQAQPPFDQAKVDEIRRAISEGRFRVRANAIADRLIEEAKQLQRERG